MSVPVTILLIEDDEIDREVFMRSAKRQKIPNPVVYAKDGVEAMEILRTSGTNAISRPYLILLDLNIPRLSGLELLAELRADERLKTSLVFVLTSSDDDRDKSAAYEMNIAGYLLKSRFSAEPDKVIAMLQSYTHYVVFPPNRS